MFTRKSIIKKTVEVGSYTLLSRLLGIIREALTVRYMGASALSDAYFTAFQVPNSLRKMFADGAVSAAFVPTIVQKVRKEGTESIGSMMTLAFLVFESMVLCICVAIMSYAGIFMKTIAPGFTSEQIEQGALFLQILMPFIFLISTSALLAGPLQAVGHFFIPAFGQVIINIVYILGLLICLFWSLPVTALCWFVLLGGLLQLLAHFAVFFLLGFRFSLITKKDLISFGTILGKFFFCLVSMGALEIGFFIDSSFASLLSKGSVSLIYYANRFMGIPLGIFAVAFSTILLPHFSRVSSYAPKRLGFYLHEATKLVWWVTIPAVIIMILLSKKIFITLFLSDKFTLDQAYQAASILNAFLLGLFFFSINKILSNVYYALHYTFIPGFVTVIAMLLNAFLNWVLLTSWQTIGLAVATSISGVFQTVVLFFILHQYLDVRIYFLDFIRFIIYYTLQMIVVGIPCIFLYIMIEKMIPIYLPFAKHFFLEGLGFWFWAGPLCIVFMMLLFCLAKVFNVRILFLEKD